MSNPIAELIELLTQENISNQDINQAISSMPPDDVALALESIPVSQRRFVWDSIKQTNRLDILVEMRGESRLLLLKELNDLEIAELFSDVDAEDLLEIADSLPDPMIEIALQKMDAKQREYYQQGVTYEEDEAGRWVDHELIVAAQTIRVSEAMRLFRRVSAPYSDTLYLVNRTGRWVGCVHLRSILNAQPHEPVSGFMEEEYPFIDAQTDVVKAADLLEKSEVSALPVLDSNQLLVGRFHAGHALEARRLEQEAVQMSNTGLDEDSDLFSPVRRSAASRGFWLGINLLTAFMASAFIGLFEATLEQVVALAVLMPIVASMGGIAGSQTLTLIVRGLALGQITRANFSSLLKKELQVGGLNGIVWSLCIGAAVLFWFQSPMLGFTIAMAIVINILMAALSGVIIPVVLDKLRIDPALSGSVILTTVTDIAGYIAFLGLGTLLLL